MEKVYDPQSFETRLYEWWNKNGFFHAEDESHKPPFVIMMPPPNITGALHNGHALGDALEDALIRWKRMQGYNALWQPGTDHAGIATQMIVERELSKQGKSRREMGRKAFIDEVWKWKEKNGAIILNQKMKLGTSADWTRLRFTMDEGLSQAVREVFVTLYEQGLMYRGTRLINWCTRCQTALSDLEVVPKEKKGYFWHLKYKLEDGKTELVIATTRPETLLGDTAVAVHPEDERYKKLIGKKVVLPLLNRKISVIADEYVDREFGSGALKVTPGHDFNDYELGSKHKLPTLSVFDKEGKVTKEGAPYQGLKISQARDKIIQDLEAAGLLVKTEEHTHQAGTCQRCETVVEPMISDQWFLNVKPLAEKALGAVRKGEKLSLQEVDKRTDAIKIVPDGWTNTYYQWMENIRDWCVSRQLWWGHQIPAWYCGDCGKITVARQDPIMCVHCKSHKVKQDEDVLDTWFSSGLWPFSTLGWPEKSKSMKTFYPGTVLETGFDILFFWVARMIMMGMHFNDGKVPFTRVYLHAMVRDEKGQKMSKTKGNVIDPLDIIAEYGADAFRFTLITMAGQGRDIKLSLDRIDGYRAFCNKLWNASRYVLLRLENAQVEEWSEGDIKKKFSTLHPINRWIMSSLHKTIKTVNSGFEEYRMNESASALYQFMWGEFCDWYIEFSKELLDSGDQNLVKETQSCLLYVLREILKLAHPIIPFVSEEIFQNIDKAHPRKATVGSTNPLDHALMMQKYPIAAQVLKDEVSENAVGLWKEAVERLRNFRGESGISPKTQMQVSYLISDTAKTQIFVQGESFVQSLAGLKELKRVDQAMDREDVGRVVTSFGSFFVELKGLVDTAGEKTRLEKERKQILVDIDFVENKLSKPEFTAKAPPALVEKERQKLLSYKAKLTEIDQALVKLTKL